MIINHNLGAMNANRMVTVNSNNASKAMEKLSSGLRINSAADDASGLAISEKMKGQISGLNTASSNAQNAVSLTQTADGALTETTSVLQRMRELAVQSSNDTNTAADRSAIQVEATALTAQITNIATTTQFNTKNLLDGSIGSGKELSMQIGANAGQTMTIGIGDMTASGLSVNALSFTTATGASAAITAIDAATAKVSSQRAQIGAYQNRLTSTINNLGTTSQNLSSAQLSIADVDMAATMAEYSKNNIESQAAQAMISQANQQPSQVLQLLR
jgi:flagellin